MMEKNENAVITGSKDETDWSLIIGVVLICIFGIWFFFSWTKKPAATPPIGEGVAPVTQVLDGLSVPQLSPSPIIPDVGSASLVTQVPQLTQPSIIPDAGSASLVTQAPQLIPTPTSIPNVGSSVKNPELLNKISKYFSDM
jgi:hypothetical protein